MHFATIWVHTPEELEEYKFNHKEYIVSSKGDTLYVCDGTPEQIVGQVDVHFVGEDCIHWEYRHGRNRVEGPSLSFLPRNTIGRITHVPTYNSGCKTFGYEIDLHIPKKQLLLEIEEEKSLRIIYPERNEIDEWNLY